MGRLSLDTLVHTTDSAIERAMLEAKKQIFQLVKQARKDDAAFFEIPYNPFSIEVRNYSSILFIRNQMSLINL